MTEAEKEELQILQYCFSYIDNIFKTQIMALTAKALSIKMDEKDRIAILGGIGELRGMLAHLNGRKEKLTVLKQKES